MLNESSKRMAKSATTLENTNGPQATEHVNNMTFRQIVSPLIKTLKLSGIYSESFGHTNGSSSTLARVLHRVYCSLVVMVIFVDFLRYLTVFRQIDEISSKMMGICAYTCYYAMNALYCVFFLRASVKHFPDLLNNFEQYRNDYGLHFNTQKTRRNILVVGICIVVFNVLASFSFAAMVLFIYIPLGEWSLIKTNFTPFENEPFEIVVLFSIFFIIVRFVATMVQYGVSFFYVVISFALHAEFNCVSKTIKAVVSEGIEEINVSRIEHFRRQHEAIKSILMIGNEIAQHVIFICFASIIPSVCFTLYGLIHKSFPVDDLTSLSHSIVAGYINIVAVTIIGAMVSSAAHEPLEHLYRIDLTTLPERTIQQINMFVASLNGPTIGYNVYGMFVVDKTSILMLFGTIITYSVVVLQFAPGNGPCGNITNVTNS